jgi:hypothetical protein
MIQETWRDNGASEMRRWYRSPIIGHFRTSSQNSISELYLRTEPGERRRRHN